MLSLVLLPNIELKLPSLLSVARDAPEFERADLGDTALQSHRQHGLFLPVDFERPFERAYLLNLIDAPVFNHSADLILFANGRTEEAELRRFADDEAEFAVRNFGLCSLFHSEWNDAERLERSGQTGDSGHRAFDADVVGARSAAADAYAATAAGAAVISRASRHGVIEVWRVQYLFRAKRIESFGDQPVVERLDQTIAQQ